MFFFVGSYTEEGSPAPAAAGAGITSCYFDPQTGTVQIIDSVFQRNPSYPITSANGKILYAAEEMFATNQTQLVSYNILKSGRLAKLNAVALPGDYACHLAIANQAILTANYVSGDILVYKLEKDGSIGPLTQRIQHNGSGANKERQEAPHPHMLYTADDNAVFCVDLGIDEVKAYKANIGTGHWESFTELDLKVKDGAGARHIDMNKEWVALIGELSGELFLYRTTADKFQPLDSISLGEKEMSAAAIRIHANGKFVYCSERKTNNIYAFMISENKLQPVGVFPSGGTTPRDISIDPTGKWLLAANQDSNTIAVFLINEHIGTLQLVCSYFVATPSCICWQ